MLKPAAVGLLACVLAAVGPAAGRAAAPHSEEAPAAGSFQKAQDGAPPIPSPVCGGATAEGVECAVTEDEDASMLQLAGRLQVEDESSNRDHDHSDPPKRALKKKRKSLEAAKGDDHIRYVFCERFLSRSPNKTFVNNLRDFVFALAASEATVHKKSLRINMRRAFSKFGDLLDKPSYFCTALVDSALPKALEATKSAIQVDSNHDLNENESSQGPGSGLSRESSYTGGGGLAEADQCEIYDGVGHVNLLTCCAKSCGSTCGLPTCKGQCCASNIPDNVMCQDGQAPPCQLPATRNYCSTTYDSWDDAVSMCLSSVACVGILKAEGEQGWRACGLQKPDIQGQHTWFSKVTFSTFQVYSGWTSLRKGDPRGDGSPCLRSGSRKKAEKQCLRSQSCAGVINVDGDGQEWRSCDWKPTFEGDHFWYPKVPVPGQPSMMGLLEVYSADGAWSRSHCIDNWTGSQADAAARCLSHPSCIGIYDARNDNRGWRYCRIKPTTAGTHGWRSKFLVPSSPGPKPPSSTDTVEIPSLPPTPPVNDKDAIAACCIGRAFMADVGLEIGAIGMASQSVGVGYGYSGEDGGQCIAKVGYFRTFCLGIESGFGMDLSVSPVYFNNYNSIEGESHVWSGSAAYMGHFGFGIITDGKNKPIGGFTEIGVGVGLEMSINVCWSIPIGDERTMKGSCDIESFVNEYVDQLARETYESGGYMSPSKQAEAVVVVIPLAIKSAADAFIGLFR